MSRGDDYLPDVWAKPSWMHLARSKHLEAWHSIIPTSASLSPPALFLFLPKSLLPPRSGQFQGWSKKNNIPLFSAQRGNSISSQFPSCQSCTEGPLRLLMRREKGVESEREWESLSLEPLSEIFPSSHQSPQSVMATV